MQKKTKPTTWQAVMPFSVYLDDLRDLFDIVSDVSSTVEMETDTYRDIANTGELSALQGQTIHELTISGSKEDRRQVEVWLGPNGAHVWIASEQPELVGTLAKAQRVMWRHMGDVAEGTTWSGLATVSVIFPLVAVGLTNYVLAALLAILTGALALIAFRESRRRYVRIVLVERNEAPGFLSRNRDGIVVGVIVTVVGSALLLVGAELVKVVRGAVGP